jgi:hypothetical protein
VKLDYVLSFVLCRRRQKATGYGCTLIQDNDNDDGLTDDNDRGTGWE